MASSPSSDLLLHSPPPPSEVVEGDRVLLLGEGNFSFAASLASLAVSSLRLHCTSFDSLSALKERYPEVSHFLRVLAAKEGVVLEHGIDATALHRHYPGHSFDQVVFNFPHLGVEDCRLHSSLLAHLLHSSRAVLRPGGSVHISLSSDQSSRWRLLEVSRWLAELLQLCLE